MKRPHRQGSRRRMTPLERGLAAQARQEGLTWETIATALRRDINTLKRAVAQHRRTFHNESPLGRS